MPNVNQIIIGSVILVVIVVGIFLYSMGKITPIENTQPKDNTVKENVLAPETYSLSGSVVSIDINNNSFVMNDQQSKQDFVIKVGADTEFIRLGFPFDPASPPEGLESFVPERLDTTIEKLEDKDFVFVRSSHEIKSGKEVLNPIEIQILP